MQTLVKLAVEPLLFTSGITLAMDGHCITRIKQTSVDFPSGSVETMNCGYFPKLSATEVDQEKNECKSKSRKNRVKEWKSGLCPNEGLISTCTFDRYGEAALKHASIIHVYEEIGGNLSLESELRLAHQQCNTMTGHAGQFTDVSTAKQNKATVFETKAVATERSGSTSTNNTTSPAIDMPELNKALDTFKQLFKKE